MQEVVRGKWPAAVHGTAEGAFCVPLDKLEHAFELLTEAASQAGLKLGIDIGVYVDYGAVTHDMYCV